MSTDDHGVPSASRAARERVTRELTVIVPAFNEAASIADTVKSLLG